MADSPNPSHPPSEPRPLSRPGLDLSVDRPGRVQVVAALLLLLVLVVIPLYLWRRPRAVAEDPAAASASAAAALAQAEADAASASAAKDSVASKNGVTLSPAQVLECHDPGPHHTPPSECDHLPGFEQAFAKAILDATSCAASAQEGGDLVYVADVSYARKRRPIFLTLPHEGRTLRGSRAVSACATAVKHNLSGAVLDTTHGHARYKLEITATYPTAAP